MDRMNQLSGSIPKGPTVLNEYESKKLLKAYGIRIPDEIMAHDASEAIRAADRIGFPVVVKGLGTELAHKTERGLVQLNLTHHDAVAGAVETISRNAGHQLQGFLIQPHITGTRELVAGMFRDRQFGPVIMFGIGGIFTEALSDITFRVAPITEIIAGEMLEEIKAKSILGSIRGQKTVDRRQVVSTLLALSRIAADRPDIREIDINPLIITPDGNPMAVDALVIINARDQEHDGRPPVSPETLMQFFHPGSIAFIGVSATLGKWGHMLFTLTKSAGYTGDIYLVNPKGLPIAGCHVYRSITEIPGTVDLAVVTIPALSVRPLIPELRHKGVRRMLVVSSGFSETGPEGSRLESELVKDARDAGIVILGPNTMGISNPHIRFYCTGSHVQPCAGSTAVISQSGNMGMQLLHFAEHQGIGIRAFSGIGNEAMVTVEDHIDAFGDDPLTQTLMMYIENIKNGRRFLESAYRTGRKKPIVLLKGGQSRTGQLAAMSHTGALASDARVFNAACRQAGIVKVDYPMDLVDLSAAFSSLPLPAGTRVGIMSFGGGWGVITADLCTAFGLEVPALSPEVMEHINRILPPYWNKMNPIDLVGQSDPSIPLTIMEQLLKWDQCDGIINLGILGRSRFQSRQAESAFKVDPAYTPDFVKSFNRASQEVETRFIEMCAKLMEQYRKPVFGVSLPTITTHKTVYQVNGCRYKGVFFPTPERAVKAFVRMSEYYRFIHSMAS